MREGPSAIAARISARLVTDFDPGTLTFATTGKSALGAAHRPVPVVAAFGSALTPPKPTGDDFRDLGGQSCTHWR